MCIKPRANAFESQYRENAPRRRASLSNPLKLVLKKSFGVKSLLDKIKIETAK
jgi:hypothetical protein